MRLRLPMGGSLEMEVESSSSTADFQLLLLRRTGVPVQHQRLRFGYPPRVLVGSSADTLRDAGMQHGEVVYLENIHDLFLGNLEGGEFTMAELLDRLPEGEEMGDGSLGALFREALVAFEIDIEERHFWDIVRDRMHLLVSGTGAASEAQVAQLRAGLLVLQQLFRSHNLRERLSLILDCLPDGGIGRSSHGSPVQLHVARAKFLSSVAPQVLKLNRGQLLSPVRVTYEGEAGEDAGGLTRDFFSSFAQRLTEDSADGAAPLWELTGRGALQPAAHWVATARKHPSKLSTSALYCACGRVFSIAVLHGCKLGRPLSRAFVKLLIGSPPQTLVELQEELNHEAGDHQDFRGSRQILEKPLEECGLAGSLTFTCEARGADPNLGKRDLVPGGSRIVVTDANKAEWLETLLREELVTALEPAATAFRQGLVDVFGGTMDTCPLLCLLGAEDLIELWGRGGVRRDEVSAWRAVAQVSPAVGQQGEWLWQVLAEDYDDEMRGKVLQFATGSSSLGHNGLQLFTVEPADGGDERLPSAMTCGNMLQLPRYSCRAVLSERLRSAAESCGTFQLA